MPLVKRKVESALTSKGFEMEQRDHRYFVYITVDGELTPVRTKTSHSNKPKDLSDSLVHLMARQVHLSTGDFTRLVECPLTREAYEAMLREKGLI